MSDGAQMDLLTRIEASLEFMNDGGPIGDRVDFVNLREVLEGSREALLKLDEYEHRAKLHMDRCQHDMERIVALEQQNEVLASRLDSAENAMREVVSHLQRSQRGSTHWAGCPDVHPICQAIDMLVDALSVTRHRETEP